MDGVARNLSCQCRCSSDPGSAELLDQALMVSEELIRVAVLWSEMWNEALEEVCGACY